MARITDENKMKVVKQTLLDIIVRDGSSHASIAKMAKEAGVSSGYLYRHYDSKESLINDLYQDKFNYIYEIILSVLEKHNKLKDLIYNFYQMIVSMAQANENDILFFLKMMTDYSVKMSAENKAQLFKTMDRFSNKFKDELNPNITKEQIFIQVLGTILLFINLRKRVIFSNSEIDEKEINLFCNMTLKAIK